MLIIAVVIWVLSEKSCSDTSDQKTVTNSFSTAAALKWKNKYINHPVQPTDPVLFAFLFPLLFLNSYLSCWSRSYDAEKLWEED